MPRPKDIILPTTIKIKARNKVRVQPRRDVPELKPYQYKKGQSGNPSGIQRPGNERGKISKAYEVALNQKVPDKLVEQYQLEPGATWADFVARQMIMRAINQEPITAVDMPAVVELREVTEGKLVEKKELAGAGGQPLNPPQFNINFKDAEDDEDT